jgi:hypothetical protein
MNYSNIFEQKKSFAIKYSMGGTYTYQDNDENGELINQDSNVVAQIFEKNPNKNYFVVAGMFMGDIVFKSIFYRSLMSPNPTEEVPRTDIENLM